MRHEGAHRFAQRGGTDKSAGDAWHLKLSLMIPPHIKAFFNKEKDIKESFNVITRAADRASLAFL
jgi:hypothetical protein